MRTIESNSSSNEIAKTTKTTINQKKVYIHLDCETRGPKAGIHQLFQLSMLVVFDEADIVPDSEKPFTPNVCPCYVDQKTWSIHHSDIKWDNNTQEFWNQHQRIYDEITQNCQPASEVVQQISDFLKHIKSTYIIIGIVMSPSWFDWSHFVYTFNLFSKTVVDCFDIGKLNVICMKSMINATNHIGIQSYYHPNLPHTHNSADDVKSAAYKFYWLQRQLSITRMHLNECAQNKGFKSYSEMVKHELKNTGDIKLRWKPPVSTSYSTHPAHSAHSTHSSQTRNNQPTKITLNDYVTKQSFDNNSFTWQQQKFVRIKVNTNFSKMNKNKRFH